MNFFGGKSGDHWGFPILNCRTWKWPWWPNVPLPVYSTNSRFSWLTACRWSKSWWAESCCCCFRQNCICMLQILKDVIIIYLRRTTDKNNMQQQQGTSRERERKKERKKENGEGKPHHKEKWGNWGILWRSAALLATHIFVGNLIGEQEVGSQP